MNYYKDKHILIVGGSEGIGLALSKELSKYGANLTLLSRNQSKLNDAIQTIGDKSTDTISSDITKYDVLEEKLTALCEKKSVPDIVVNCAGFSHPGFFEEVSIEDERKMMDLNYFGTMNVLKILLPKMANRGSGHVVNVSSICGFLGLFGYSGYCGSKFAVIGLSEALKREYLPKGISVSVACPPGTKTPGFDEENKIKPKEVLDIEEKAKVLTPEEVAHSILKQVSKKKFMIIPSLDGKLAYYLNKFAPAALEQFIKR